jgi:hypothetical protein
VAVAGARGLDEKMLMAAVYNEAEIQLLHGYAMSRSEAEQFHRPPVCKYVCWHTLIHPSNLRKQER